ncbi:MAG: transcription-repair coupling factor [Lachnospiraceae bacterium]|nr:transcription-repair coupling factor [Lachnospiraceae bacterium]
MNAFLQPLQELNEYEQAKEWLQNHNGIWQFLGCTDSQKLHMACGLARDIQYHLILTYEEQKAKEIYEEYVQLEENVYLYPAKDFIFFAADIHGNLLVRQRMAVIQQIAELKSGHVTVITTIDGLMDKVMPLIQIRERRLHIDYDSTIHLESLRKQLVHMGYEHTGQVDVKGQFSIRGGIIDLFPLTEENPFRIELWGDEIDSIRSFDVQSQRSIENLENITIYPAAELAVDSATLEKGLQKIEKEEKKAVEKFRKAMQTEEGFRLKTNVEELLERVQNGQMDGLDMYLPYFVEHPVSFLDYFPKEQTLITLDDPARLGEKASVVETEFRESMLHRLEQGHILSGQTKVLFEAREIIGRINTYKCVAYSILEKQQAGFHMADTNWLDVRGVPSYRGDFEMLVKDLGQWKKKGYRVLLASPSATRAKRLAEEFMQRELSSFYTEDEAHNIQPGEIMTVKCGIRRGYEYPLLKYVVISEGDIFGAEKKKKKKRKQYEGQKISNFNDLKVGDYVVHEDHGIGIYRGIEKITVEHIEKDYMKIEYGDGGNLYVLATRMDAIQKYADGSAKQPRLNKLGSKEWKKTKKRVKGAVQEVAKDLVELYAKRQQHSGYVYSEDTVWQKEFEELFPFEETEDQLLAIEAAKRDMESRKMMDRLICGDVGFGKTEIAIRAAFKAVQESKQVVYLVPTTILAQQHYSNFAQRMKGYPIKIELLCRFRTPGQQKAAIEGLKKGTVDIVIGTHRVLSKDVTFKDLGLLIIDEEQRFGVTHKEKIKKMKENIDVLTLTATPIPRTLHMSLIGIRDMSVLEEPPMDRVPIQTYVMEFSEEMIREALNRELNRNGQVYYVYNRVKDIDEMALKVQSLVPEANVAFAHGQMRERELERIMYDFVNGDIDVLVSTTIIETGLDISNVNTIIIHDADNFGLSQLYQLRGRVGRSNRTAYAFLMYRRNKMLKEVAEKRLQAIREFTDLGSGIKIAMKDLEIRGAGSILGEQQSGHMEAVGYDLYCKMLNEAVKQLKGTGEEEKVQAVVEVDVDAFIPERYIPNEFQKLDIYKRIAAIENEEECEDMKEELIDRFSDIPPAVENLFDIALIRAKASQLDITEIKARTEYVRLSMYEKAKIDVARIPELLEQYKGILTFKADTPPYFIYRLVKNNRKEKGKENILKELLQLLEDMKLLQL